MRRWDDAAGRYDQLNQMKHIALYAVDESALKTTLLKQYAYMLVYGIMIIMLSPPLMKSLARICFA